MDDTGYEFYVSINWLISEKVFSVFVFFFKQKTAYEIYQCDWSSDVCSSDLAIGCVTNIASALLMRPEIAERIVVLWTAGYPTWCPRPNTEALNLVQDVVAARALFDSRVPLVYFPGYYVGAQLRISLPDVEAWVRGRGAAGNYLHDLYTNNPLHEQRAIADHYGRTWVMWDMITIAWLIEPSWVPSEIVSRPTIDDELRWTGGPGIDREMREAHDIDRDAIFRDFFTKLDAHAN